LFNGNQDASRPPTPAGLSRRDALLRSFGLFGGGVAATGLLRSKACLDRRPPERSLANPLEMGPAELLCQGEILLAVAECAPDIPKMDIVLTRLIAAALGRFSPENDLLAARCLLLLGSGGALPGEAARLAASAPERSALRVTWERARPEEVGQ